MGIFDFLKNKGSKNSNPDLNMITKERVEEAFKSGNIGYLDSAINEGQSKMITESKVIKNALNSDDGVKYAKSAQLLVDSGFKVKGVDRDHLLMISEKSKIVDELEQAAKYGDLKYFEKAMESEPKLVKSCQTLKWVVDAAYESRQIGSQHAEIAQMLVDAGASKKGVEQNQLHELTNLAKPPELRRQEAQNFSRLSQADRHSSSIETGLAIEDARKSGVQIEDAKDLRSSRGSDTSSEERLTQNNVQYGALLPDTANQPHHPNQNRGEKEQNGAHGHDNEASMRQSQMQKLPT